MIKTENLLIIFWLWSITSCVTHKDPPATEKADQSISNGINIGQYDSLQSKILGQDRKLVIYLPESHQDPDRKRDRYPVVYLLDGSYPFVPFVGMLKQFSEMNDTKILPEMIVVGIENIDHNSRMMDFSPTTAGNPEQYGGGKEFLKFVQTELFPYIEKKYSGSQHRTLVGHSFGGLVVINALAKRPEMFTNYLMIDGSLYFDNELFLNNNEYSLEGKDLKNKNLFIAIANTATYGSDLESIKIDTIGANKYVRHSLKLVEKIESMENNLNMDWKYYENDTHGSAAFSGLTDAFRFFYSWFEFKEEHKYRSKYFQPENDNDRFANLTKAHFANVSEKLEYKFIPDPYWLSGFAGSLNNYHNSPVQALETYKLNVDYHPDSANAHKDLADFYMSQRDTVSASKHYEKALELEK